MQICASDAFSDVGALNWDDKPGVRSRAPPAARARKRRGKGLTPQLSHPPHRHGPSSPSPLGS